MLCAMSFPAPEMPAFPADQAGTYPGVFRYEDCTQDGRLIPIAMPPSLGGLWQHVIAKHAGSNRALAAGVIPILTRLTLASMDQPIRIDRPAQTRAGFLLARDRADGEPTRLFMNVWTEIRGMAGRIGPRQVDAAYAVAGTVFAEHTYTRLFAPPDQRRVTHFDVEGLPRIPEAVHAAQPPETAMAAPDGARWLDELAPDPAEVGFTLDQTDANQHVNSLVYVRTFLDAVGRRLAATGGDLKLRSRAVDVAYRKPCFAGDRVRVHLRRFALGTDLGAAGLVEGHDGKPRCYVRVLLSA